VKAKTLEELLVHLNLSQEEKTRYGELIEECLDRERQILACQKQSEEGLKTMNDYIETVINTLEEVHKSLQQINGSLGEVFLRRIPESNLPKA
jgi:hypothetical protein